MSDLPSPVPNPGEPAPPISRAIYGMPMFATLLSADVQCTVSWYTQALDFIVLFSMPDRDTALLVHLRRWQFQDLLVRPASDPLEPGTGSTLSFAAAYDQIDPLAERARRHGGGSIDGPVDTAWNTRDLKATDPDGNVVILTAARPPGDQDTALNERMHRWSAEQGLVTRRP